MSRKLYTRAAWPVFPLTVLLSVGFPVGLSSAADTPKVGTAARQVESGASQVGRGVEEAAKGVGNTVVEGAKLTGEKLQEVGKSAQPQVENAWEQAKDGATAAGGSVKQFFNRLLGK